MSCDTDLRAQLALAREHVERLEAFIKDHKKLAEIGREIIVEQAREIDRLKKMVGEGEFKP